MMSRVFSSGCTDLLGEKLNLCDAGRRGATSSSRGVFAPFTFLLKATMFRDQSHHVAVTASIERAGGRVIDVLNRDSDIDDVNGKAVPVFVIPSHDECADEYLPELVNLYRGQHTWFNESGWAAEGLPHVVTSLWIFISAGRGELADTDVGALYFRDAVAKEEAGAAAAANGDDGLASERLPMHPVQMAKFELLVSLGNRWTYGVAYSDHQGHRKKRNLKDFIAYVEETGRERGEDTSNARNILFKYRTAFDARVPWAKQLSQKRIKLSPAEDGDKPDANKAALTALDPVKPKKSARREADANIACAHTSTDPSTDPSSTTSAHQHDGDGVTDDDALHSGPSVRRPLDAIYEDKVQFVHASPSRAKRPRQCEKEDEITSRDDPDSSSPAPPAQTSCHDTILAHDFASDRLSMPDTAFVAMSSIPLLSPTLEQGKHSMTAASSILRGSSPHEATTSPPSANCGSAVALSPPKNPSPGSDPSSSRPRSASSSRSSDIDKDEPKGEAAPKAQDTLPAMNDDHRGPGDPETHSLRPSGVQNRSSSSVPTPSSRTRTVTRSWLDRELGKRQRTASIQDVLDLTEASNACLVLPDPDQPVTSSAFLVAASERIWLIFVNGKHTAVDDLAIDLLDELNLGAADLFESGVRDDREADRLRRCLTDHGLAAFNTLLSEMGHA